MDIEQLKENINSFTNIIHRNFTNFRRFFSIPTEDSLDSIAFSTDGINLITGNSKYNQITHRQYPMSNFIRWLEEVAWEEKEGIIPNISLSAEDVEWSTDDDIKCSCPDVSTDDCWISTDDGIKWYPDIKGTEERIAQLELTVKKLQKDINSIYTNLNKVNSTIAPFQVYR